MASLSDIKDAAIPFGVYDFFGYLLPGLFFIVIYVVDHDTASIVYEKIDINHLNVHTSTLKTVYLMRFLTWGDASSDFKLVPFVLLIITAYLIGHLIAAVSSVAIEKFFLVKTFGQPYENLLGVNPNKGRLYRMLANRYCCSLNESFLARIKHVIHQRFDYEVSPYDYSWIAFSDIIKYMPVTYQRIQHFVSLYGFSRNMCAMFIYTF